MDLPSLPEFSTGQLRWPVDVVRVTPHGEYLYDRSTYRPDGRTHLGLDLGGKRGTAVYAPEDGEVVARWTSAPINRADYRADARPWNGYGPAGVMIRGASGRYHVLAHLLASDLAELGPVSMGARVGSMSGLRHVHWEVRTKPHQGRGETHRDIVIDPRTLVDDGVIAAPAAVEVIPTPARRSGATGAGAAVLVVALALVAVVVSRGRPRR